MQAIPAILLLLLGSCSALQNQLNPEATMRYTQSEVLHRLDSAFNQQPTEDYPAGNEGDIKYSFFLDLEHGYCETAGSRIHLYADSTRWAIVFEKCGYQNRGNSAEIELDYVGNCINYPIEKYAERSYISNASSIVLISSNEYDRISDETGFELINPAIPTLNIHGRTIILDHNPAHYLQLGINPRTAENPKKLIGFGDLIRFLSATKPELVSATEAEIKQHIPPGLPKIMTINEFYFSSFYDKAHLPSQQETYQLIAKVVTTRDTSFWQPALTPNNHWSNWESGHL